MVPQWIIERKRDGAALTDDEIGFFIRGYTRGDIPDYQMSALAMAVLLRGATPAETASWTRHMMESGETFDLSSIPRPKIDKHSTGGVGDKVSLILAPMVAACGVAVPMVVGRGLGITGGTADKLESIPGYRTHLTQKEFRRILNRCGCAIMAQTTRLAPADRKLYALRDVTGTVPSIPLIVSSILSKKLAEGIDALVLDVKCGSGAFMKTSREARTLARTLVEVGTAMGTRTEALLTRMDQPLGLSAGNAVEVAEAIAALQGQGPPDLMEVTFALGIRMLRLGRVTTDPHKARRMLEQTLASGTALERFRTMVQLQGGDVRVVDQPTRLPRARVTAAVRAPRSGILAAVDANAIGRACVLLGAGRMQTTDRVDPAAGITGLGKVGDRIHRGQTLAWLHAGSRRRLDSAVAGLATAFTISQRTVRVPSVLIEEDVQHERH